MERINKKCVIISPVRNEAKYLPALIQCMENQTIRPAEWVIVDDGSSDNTEQIVRRAAAKHNWINFVQKPDRGSRSVGPGVVEAFYYGYERLQTSDYDFIAKMDGDLEFDSEYIEALIGYFEKDEHLGSASGKVFLLLKNGSFVEERIADEMTSGAFNFYRRKTFKDIGGFVPMVMWDGIAYHRARMNGWRTRSIRDSRLNIIHKRLMGSSQKNIINGRLRWGKGQYFMGTHPLYIFAVSVYRMFERPFLIGGTGILLGYFSAAIRKMKQYGDNTFRKSLHAWQMERLKLGKRLEQFPENKKGLYPV